MSEPAENALSPAPVTITQRIVSLSLHSLHRGDDRVGHFRRDGVELLRAIERDDGNLAVDLEQHVLVHGGSYLSPPLRRLAW